MKSYWPALAPLAAMLVLTAVVVAIGAQVAPSLAALVPPISKPDSIEGYGRFAEASLVWAAVGTLVVMALVAASAISIWFIRWGAGKGGPGRLLIAWPIVYGIVILILDKAWETTTATVPLEGMLDAGLVAFPLRSYTWPCNALTAATIAFLFSASTALIIRACGSPADAEELARRLQWLLAAGAIATVLGVSEIAALHRLPGAAASGAAARTAERAVVAEGLQVRLGREVTHPPPEWALLGAWARSALGAEAQPGAIDAAAAGAMRVAEDGGPAWDALRDMIVAHQLRPADEAARERVVETFDGVAAHMASYWGLIFTASLALVYLPAAAAISAAGRQNGTPVLAQSPQEGWHKPLVRVLATLAPLLVGVMAEVIKAISAYAGGT